MKIVVSRINYVGINQYTKSDQQIVRGRRFTGDCCVVVVVAS